jgi:hypothetical protein
VSDIWQSWQDIAEVEDSIRIFRRIEKLTEYNPVNIDWEDPMSVSNVMYVCIRFAKQNRWKYLSIVASAALVVSRHRLSKLRTITMILFWNLRLRSVGALLGR